MPVRAAKFPAAAGSPSGEEQVPPKRASSGSSPDALSAPAHYSPSRVRGNSRGLLFVLRERLQFRFFNVEVGVDVRNVFVVFQFFHQPQHLVGLLA